MGTVVRKQADLAKITAREKIIGSFNPHRLSQMYFPCKLVKSQFESHFQEQSPLTPRLVHRRDDTCCLAIISESLE